VEREPEGEERQHGVKGGDAGRVVARADQRDLDRHQHGEPEAHPDRARGPRPGDRQQEDEDRQPVEDPAERLVGVEALGPEDPEAGEEDCTTMPTAISRASHW
jgi:hypothetical protein